MLPTICAQSGVPAAPPEKRKNKAMPKTVKTLTKVKINPLRVTSVSERIMGFSTLLPLRSLGASSFGAWMTTSSSMFGTVIVFLQLGHGPFLPANFSLT